MNTTTAFRVPIVIIHLDLYDRFLRHFLNPAPDSPDKYTLLRIQLNRNPTWPNIISNLVRNTVFSSTNYPKITIWITSDANVLNTFDDISGFNVCPVFDGIGKPDWEFAVKQVRLYVDACETNPRPGINVYTGPMYAGKSTELVRRNLELHYPVVQNKTRQKFEWSARTHGGKAFREMFHFNALFPENLALDKEYAATKIPQWKLYVNAIRHMGLCIDEFQFFTLRDADYTILDNMARHGIDIHIAILVGDFKRVPWENFGRILAMADKITHLTSKCHYCQRPAPFSQKISGKSERVEIDKDLYVPTCRLCYELYDN